MNKNYRRIKIISTATIIALMMTGCTVALDKIDDKNETITIAEEKELTIVENEDKLLVINSGKINEETEAYIIEVDMPIITGFESKEFENSINKKLNDFISTYIEEVKTMALEIQEEGYLTSPYFLGTGYSVQVNNSDYLSLMINYNEYTGGAHGNYFSEAFTYDVKNEKVLSLNDLFLDGVDYMTPLQENVLKAIENKRSTSEYGDQLHSWYEGLEEELITFTLEAEGLGIHFQPYEIGPYAEGAPSFIIPFGAFDGLLAINPY